MGVGVFPVNADLIRLIGFLAGGTFALKEYSWPQRFLESKFPHVR
jgi:hypothetical protein